VNDILVTYLDSIDERLLEDLDEEDEVHGSLAFLARRAGVVHHYQKGFEPGHASVRIRRRDFS
jgi:hypothetical protein